MPIYEFYCPDCHKVYRFLSRKVGTERRPSCPRCARPELERQVSLFAVARGSEKGGEGEASGQQVDDRKLAQTIRTLEKEAEGTEEDPRAAARLMRKLYEATGFRAGPNLEEAMERLENGEEPEAIEQELGDALEEEDPFAAQPSKDAPASRLRTEPPSVDENLYDL